MGNTNSAGQNPADSQSALQIVRFENQKEDKEIPECNDTGQVTVRYRCVYTFREENLINQVFD